MRQHKSEEEKENHKGYQRKREREEERRQEGQVARCKHLGGAGTKRPAGPGAGLHAQQHRTHRIEVPTHDQTRLGKSIIS